MMGREQSGLTRRKVRINQAYSKTTTMTHFLKGFVHDTEVELLENQSSAMLNSFAAANCLIQMEEGRTEWFPNDVVTVIMLP
jgi:molybdopterin molybdotransferase